MPVHKGGSGHRTPITVEYDGGTIEWYGPRVQISIKSNCWLISARNNPKSAERYQGIFTPKPFMPRRVCKHQVTLCDTCQESWSYDYVVIHFPHHGDQGYNQGCRCEKCIKGRIKWLPASQIERAKQINIRWRMLDANQDLDPNKYGIRDVCRTCLVSWPDLCDSHNPTREAADAT